MASPRIPFNRACFQGNEQAYMAEAIARGHISGDGHFTKLCQDLLESETGCVRALLTPSGTHALEMSAILLGVGPGDEVVVPSFTFVSTANAFVLYGAKPVFIDVRPDTLNLDEALLEDALTERTKAVVPVHYGGVGCEMDRISEICEGRGVRVVEDNAHGLFAQYKGRPLGSLGCMAALSFHETKNVTCGEGGALLINDAGLSERAEIVRQKGTDRDKFFRGQVDKYTWVDVGSSYLPSDLIAAFLYAQLEARVRIQETRRGIWEYYKDSLGAWAAGRGASLPAIPEHCGQGYHMFYLLLPGLEERQALIEHLKALGILAVFHYQPLHLSRMGRRWGGRQGMFPVTESVSDRLVRLPFFNDMTRAEQDSVIEGVCSF